jgi:hypothetical protein
MTKRRHPSLIVAFAAACVALSGSVEATTVLRVDVPGMVRLSESVVRARVIATRDVDLRPAVRSGLFTDVELEIFETVRGDVLPKRHVVRLQGGTGADGIALTIPGMPRFRAGEEVVLFLERSAHGHVPCGLEQGVWRVTRGAGGEATATQSTGGLQMMARDPAGRLVPVKGHPGQSMPLEALLRAIRGA